MTTETLEYSRALYERLESMPSNRASCYLTASCPIPSRPILFNLTAKGSPFNVTVKPLKGESFSISVKDSLDAILLFKLEIQKVLNVEPQSQRLLLSGKTLNDYKTWADYGINGKDCMVNLAVLGAVQQAKNAEESDQPTKSKSAEKPSEEKDQSDANVLDDLFWAKIKSIVDTKFDGVESERVLTLWKAAVENKAQ